MVLSSTLGVSFRAAGPDDDQLLFAIYASTRQDEMEIVPWTEEQKTGFLRQQFAAQRPTIGATCPAPSIW